MTVKSNNTPGTNTLLMGPAGTGKTYSIGTLVDSEIEVMYLGIERGLESLIGYYTDNGKEVPENLGWHMLEAPEASFAQLLDSAQKVNTLSFDALAKMQDPNRSKHNQFIKILSALNGFIDQRTEDNKGPVSEWTSDRAIVIDGMTGINSAALSLVTGGKPVRSMSDWGVAQTQVENLLRLLCDGCSCHFVLLAHVEREVDAVSGGTKVMVSSLGKALAPRIPPMFGDVILATRQGAQWKWDTANGQVDLKTRSLPITANNEPSFKPIIEKWRERTIVR